MKVRTEILVGTVIEPMRMSIATIKGVAMTAMMVKITTATSEGPDWDEFPHSGILQKVTLLILEPWVKKP